MRQTKLYMLLAAIMLLAACTKGNKVVEFPLVGSSNTSKLTFEKVELTDTATVLSVRVNHLPNHWIMMSTAPYLAAQDKEYKLLGCKDFELGKEVFMPEDGDSCFTLLFEPLPEDCEKFDFIEGKSADDWKIHDIDLTDKLRTYWRSSSTGDWFIAFTDNHIVYDCAVWDILAKEDSNGKYSFTAQCGDEKITVEVGKKRRGARKISVNGASAVKCNPITSRTLPDYPVKDNRVGIKDNGYSMGDSVTIVGWLKNMADDVRSYGDEFKVQTENIIMRLEEGVFSAKIDSLGCFTLKMPLLNSSQAFLDLRRCNVVTVLEPGETYFFMYDFSTRQRLFMGSNVRLQNELLAHPYEKLYESMERSNSTAEEAMDFMHKVQTEQTKLLDELDVRVAAHPNLSQRYIDYLKGYYLTGSARSLIYAKYNVATGTFPDEYMAYVDSLWNVMLQQTPYSLYRDFNYFLIDYMYYKQDNIPGESNSIAAKIKKLADAGKITLSKKELSIVEGYDEVVDSVRKLISTLPPNEANKIVEEFDRTEYGTTILRLYSENNEIIQLYEITNTFNLSRRAIAGVSTTPALTDIYMAGVISGCIYGYRIPANEQIMEWADKNLQLPAARSMVMAMQDKYLALTSASLNNSSIKSADRVKNMSDGEKILRKLTEPYRGRYILVDVWGTWCTPCKAALAKSKEEFERLAPYNMVFLYLANRSSDETWKNVIKEYNVVGENVAHYNLPYAQQTAVENFLKVSGYPTYKLISPDGDVLDVNADPRDLDAFERMMKSLKTK
ncbi:MAG: hypothetical protein IJC08_06545 [Bacteroidaceae bacterium]|nr:hypothetical protein [Bacteroidaceae bacterium]